MHQASRIQATPVAPIIIHPASGGSSHYKHSERFEEHSGSAPVYPAVVPVVTGGGSSQSSSLLHQQALQQQVAPTPIIVPSFSPSSRFTSSNLQQNYLSGGSLGSVVPIVPVAPTHSTSSNLQSHSALSQGSSGGFSSVPIVSVVPTIGGGSSSSNYFQQQQSSSSSGKDLGHQFIYLLFISQTNIKKNRKVKKKKGYTIFAYIF